MSNSELGLYLRKKREEKGIPLFEVSTRSKIRMYYLENIEKGEFSRLPSVPNGRGFVRAYASIVGVNPDDAARMYDMEFANDEPHPVDVTRVFTPKEVRRGGAKLLVPVVMVFLFVVASGGLLWFMRGRTDRLLKLGGFTERVKMAATPTLRKLPFLNDVFVSAPSSNGDKGVSSKASPPRVGAPGKERAMAPPKVLPRSAGKRVASTPPPRPAAPVAAQVPKTPKIQPKSVSAPLGPAPAAPTTAPVGRAGGVEGEKAPARPPEGEARKEPRPKERATASPTAVQRPPKDSNRKKNEEPRNHTSSAAEAPAPSASAERTSAEGAAPSPSKPGLVADSGQAAKGPLKLSVLALEDTWLRVVVDDKNRFELLLLAGSKRLWTGSSKFLLTVGNVQGTQVSLNGLKVPLPRSSSNIVRDFVITENFLN